MRTSAEYDAFNAAMGTILKADPAKVARFSHLAGDLGIGEATIHHL